MKKSNSVKHVAAVAAIVLAATSMAVLAAPTQQVGLSTNVQDNLTVTDAADVVLPNITPGTPVTASTSTSITTNSVDGYNMYVYRDTDAATPDTGLIHTGDGTTPIADKTAFDGTAASTAAYTGTGLAFRVGTVADGTTNQATLWGTDEYAGLPVSAAPTASVLRQSDYVEGAQSVPVEFILNVPTEQKAGGYAGSFTINVNTSI